MIFCFHFFLFLLIPFLYLIHVAGCDDARGQGDDSNADNRGDDADDATDGGDGVNVTIAYRGERTGCPIEGVEEMPILLHSSPKVLSLYQLFLLQYYLLK